MTTWITDDNGNRASVEYWGSVEAAEESLKTLVNCRNCRNCNNCRNCRNCRNCSDCNNCYDCRNCSKCYGCHDCRSCRNCRNCHNCHYCDNCRNCHYCHNCDNCDLRIYHVAVPVADLRGYTWLAIYENDEWRIRAGCRNLSIPEARKHWTADDYNGPDSVKATIDNALDWVLEQDTSRRSS